MQNPKTAQLEPANYRVSKRYEISRELLRVFLRLHVHSRLLVPPVVCTSMGQPMHRTVALFVLFTGYDCMP